MYEYTYTKKITQGNKGSTQFYFKSTSASRSASKSASNSASS